MPNCNQFETVNFYNFLISIERKTHVSCKSIQVLYFMHEHLYTWFLHLLFSYNLIQIKLSENFSSAYTRF
jgi:hypothetical protein